MSPFCTLWRGLGGSGCNSSHYCKGLGLLLAAPSKREIMPEPLGVKVRHDLARAVYDDHVMVMGCPVEARVVSDLAP
jgi:hypothetical protein